MRTVKEISALTGISVRALHYYDEIGLLRPPSKSEAGYRLYDDQALERLQQILFFREFDIPLREIKAILDSPTLDREQILRTQRRMLEAKQARLQRLIASIDDILKGENKMDFTVFDRSELETLCQSSWERMPQTVRDAIIQDFGSEAQWRQHYVERSSQADIQEGYRKMLDWYGSKARVMERAVNPPSMDAIQASQAQADSLMQALARRRDMGDAPADDAVQEIIGEYILVVQAFYQMQQAKPFMLDMVRTWYRSPRIVEAVDEAYGAGMAAYFSQAVEVCCQA